MIQVIPLGRREATKRQQASGRVDMEKVTVSAELELVIDTSKMPPYKITKALLAKTKRTVTNGGLVTIRVKPGTDKILPPSTVAAGAS